MNALEVELVAFRLNLSREQGGLGRLGHFKNIVKIMWPKLIWHEWLEVQIESLCENQWVCWAGCAASGKTFAAGLYAMVWWLASPMDSTVVLTSTTAKMIRKRAWAMIRKLYTDGAGFPGNMVDSKTTLQATKGDDRSAIFAQAVAEGDTRKAVANIQGIHNGRVFVVIDEATDTPEAAFEACTNLFSGAAEFQCLVIGNPASRFDPMGKFAEPMDGWTSVGVDDEEWRTKPQLNGKPGILVRFDAEKSPNVKAERVLYPFLVSMTQMEGAKIRLGEQSPLFWKFYRGFWAPDGLVKTVFTESIIQKMEGMGKFTFSGLSHKKVAGFDPAFGGGDRAALKFAEVGDVGRGLTGIQLTDMVLLNIDANSSNPVHFQLAEQLQRECEARGVEPENVAVDATGEGGGLCDIIARIWSHRIIRVEFGGRPSDFPTSGDDIRLASEVYERKVVELWFQARLFLLSGQLRGLDASVCIEFCNRLFDDTSRRKISLQSKPDMKKSFGRSPDLADATVLAIEAARYRGATVRRVGPVSGSIHNLLEIAKAHDQIHDESLLYASVEG
jgi:hypothetical protein